MKCENDIPVNPENCMPLSRNYNVGSLRIPEDPSWPKIPERKLSNGKNSRKSWTLIETTSQQSNASSTLEDAKSCYFPCRTSSTQMMKKRSNYVDPRFKKVRNPRSDEIVTSSTTQTTETFMDQVNTRNLTKVEPGQNTVTKQVLKEDSMKADERLNEIISTRKELNEFSLCNLNKTELRNLDRILKSLATRKEFMPMLEKSKNSQTAQILNYEASAQSMPCLNIMDYNNVSSPRTSQISCSKEKPELSSEQTLTHIDCQSQTKKLTRRKKLYTVPRIKRRSIKHNKKIKSYLEKNSCFRISEPGHANTLPDCENCKRKLYYNFRRLGNYTAMKSNCYTKTAKYNRQIHKKRMEIPELRKNIIDGTNDLELTSHDRTYDSETTPKTNMHDVASQSTTIPLETQELLSRSYWQYYNKLRQKTDNTELVGHICCCGLMIDQPQAKKQKMDNSSAEIVEQALQFNSERQTIKECSALSSMINSSLKPSKEVSDTVQIREMYFNENFLPPLCLPVADSAKDIVEKTVFATKTHDIKTIVKANTLIFLGSMMYILFLFLPFLHNCFTGRGDDDNDTFNYIGFALDYISSSFKEAFGDVFIALIEVGSYFTKIQIT